MNLQQLLEFFTKNFAEYFMVFTTTLVKPTIRFHPVTGNLSSHSDAKHIAIPPQKKIINYQLNPKLFSFVVISIFIGITVNGLIPDRIPGLNIVLSEIVIVGFWLIYSTFLHRTCKYLGGRGTYLETISISLQVLSALFVLSSFLAVLLSSVFQIKEVNDWGLNAGGIISIITLHPFSIFFIIQTLLLLIYLPLAIPNIHYFDRQQKLLITLIGVVPFIFFSILLYLATGLK
ncbi:MAG: hypothetical protein AAGA60_21090 [Cyanobacteria bacterium P01_E01_bin.42]